MLYLNGEIVEPSRALISVYDHGFLYGDGIYETLRVYQGVVFKLREHLDRLFRSAFRIKLNIGKTYEELEEAVYAVLRANKLKEAYVRISISRGYGSIGLDPALCEKPTIAIMPIAFGGHPEDNYERGVKIIFSKTRRNYKAALDPMIKSLNFLNNILAKMEAIEAEAYEAVMLNYQDLVAEGTICNIFFIKRDTLFTPSIDIGILDGITRVIVMELALNLGMKTGEGHYRKQDVYESDEVFLSNTTMEIMPVRQVDNKNFAKAPGRWTKALHRAYKEYVKTCIS